MAGALRVYCLNLPRAQLFAPALSSIQAFRLTRLTTAMGTRLSGQRSGAETAFQCGQRNSLKTINVDGEHFIRFSGKSCVFKFIRLSVNVALVLAVSIRHHPLLPP